MPRSVWFACITGLMAWGCTTKKPTESVPTVQEKVSASPTPAPAKPVLKASEDDCVGPLTRSNKPKNINFADWKFRQDGYLLTQLTKDPDEEVIVGVLSDTKEFSEANRKNLKEILKFFGREKVEIVVHLGDIASTTPIPQEIEVPDTTESGIPISQERKDKIRRRLISQARRLAMKKSYDDIFELLSLLAQNERQWPVFVLSGNRECKTTYNAAMATLTEDYPNVFNMNMIRRVDLDDLDIISMPGYHDPEYIHCSWDKCLNYDSDTLAVEYLAKEANSEVLLISHGPFRQNHRDGIDVISEGDNVGNKALANSISRANIFFGAFGNILEAGGKATNQQGNNIIRPDTFVRSLFLIPGQLIQ